MNELTKQLIMSALVKCTYHIHWNENEFSDALDEILASRPTCGVEQRLFLDEVEKHGKLITAHGVTKIYHNGSVMYDSEFKNLDKVIKGE